MLPDHDPLVRRNAALALVRFHDAAGHDEIASMLRSYHGCRDGVRTAFLSPENRRPPSD